MLIELLLLATICVILPPAPSVLQEARSTLASIHAKASAAKRLRSNRLLDRLEFATSTRLLAFLERSEPVGMYHE